MRTIIVGAVLLSSVGLAAANPKHHHKHYAPPPITEYRGYYGYSGDDGYRVWEGDVDPSFGSERYGENGGTVHYGE